MYAGPCAQRWLGAWESWGIKKEPCSGGILFVKDKFEETYAEVGREAAFKMVTLIKSLKSVWN